MSLDRQVKNSNKKKRPSLFVRKPTLPEPRSPATEHPIKETSRITSYKYVDTSFIPMAAYRHYVCYVYVCYEAVFEAFKNGGA
jgi:hypothetical protein